MSALTLMSVIAPSVPSAPQGSSGEAASGFQDLLAAMSVVGGLLIYRRFLTSAGWRRMAWLAALGLVSGDGFGVDAERAGTHQRLARQFQQDAFHAG